MKFISRGFGTTVLLVGLAPATVRAAANDAITVVARPHANPRLKLSYRGFGIANLDGSPIWLNGAQLDAYMLSRRWVRIGAELEGGGGHADLMGNGAHLAYGLAGLSGGIQYPWRVTPFLDGRFAAGVLAGQLDGTLTIGTVSVTDASAVTWMYAGGVETGVEVYTFKRVYLSAALGWVRTTWRGPDAEATLKNPDAGMQMKDVTGDSLTVKVGFGI
jgi:hypothetical protein